MMATIQPKFLREKIFADFKVFDQPQNFIKILTEILLHVTLKLAAW